MKAVSAEALLPVTSLLAQQRGQAASEVEDALWSLLLDVDDLSISTGASLEELLRQDLACRISALTHAKMRVQEP